MQCTECGHSVLVSNCLCPGTPASPESCACSQRMITIYWRETGTYATEIPLASVATVLGAAPGEALDQLGTGKMPDSLDAWLAGQPGETTFTGVLSRRIEEVDIQ